MLGNTVSLGEIRNYFLGFNSDILSAYRDLSRIRGKKSCDNFYKRGLARAVRSEKSYYLSCRDLEGNVIESTNEAVRFG